MRYALDQRPNRRRFSPSLFDSVWRKKKHFACRCQQLQLRFEASSGLFRLLLVRASTLSAVIARNFHLGRRSVFARQEISFSPKFHLCFLMRFCLFPVWQSRPCQTRLPSIPLVICIPAFQCLANCACIRLCCVAQNAATVSTKNGTTAAVATKQPCRCYLHRPFLPQNAKLDPRHEPRKLENFAKRLGFCYTPFAISLPDSQNFISSRNVQLLE